MTLRPWTRRLLISAGVVLATPLFAVMVAGSFLSGMFLAMYVTIHI